LEAACRQALDLGKSARYELSSSIMDNLRSVYSNSDNTYSMADWMQWYSTKWLLAIDDLGTENGTDFVQERVTMILEYRIKNNLRTILSSNEVKGEVENRFGSRVASRLFSSNQHLSDSEVLIINNVPDYRAKKD
jgi:DNA replication protein DnaC